MNVVQQRERDIERSEHEAAATPVRSDPGTRPIVSWVPVATNHPCGPGRSTAPRGARFEYGDVDVRS